MKEQENKSKAAAMSRDLACHVSTTEAKNALKESEEKYRSIFESVQDAYFEASGDGTILEISPSIEIITKGQYHRNEMVGKPFAGVYASPDDRRVYFSKLFKQKRVTDYELSLRNKDGSIIPVTVSSVLSCDAEGKPAKITGIIRDITERKKAEETLKQSAAALNYSQEIANMGSWELNLITGKVSWSKSYYLLVGQQPDGTELPKDAFKKLVHPDDQHLLDEMMREIYQNRKAVSADMRLIMPDGNVKWVQNNIVPEFDGDTLISLKGVNIDITAKKLTEESLKHQNQRLHAIISTLPDIIFVIGLDGVYHEFYCSTPKLLLIPPDQIIGTNLRDVFDEEQTCMHLQKFSECIQSKQLITYEYSMGKLENTEYFEARLAPLDDNRVLALVRDITKRKQADNEIRNLNENLEKRITERTIQLEKTNEILEKEIQRRVLIEAELEFEKHRLADIIKGTNVGTWEWNMQTGETIFNERWAEILGYTLDEISPVSIETWIGCSHPDDLKKANELIRKHANGESDYYEFESRLKHKNGEWVWVLDRGKVHTWDDNGKPLLMSGTHQDITDRKRAEQALRDSEARFSLFMDYLPVIVFLKDHEGRTLFVNKYMDDVFGSYGWIGQTMLEVFPNELGEKLLCDDLNSMQLGYQKLEESMIQLDGKLHHYETQKFTIDRSGQEPWLGGISLDITQRKHAEEALIVAKDEAVKANQAKSEFLSRMSHELRTPMNSILGFAQLMEMGELKASHKKGVNHILNSGKHLLNLINEVLDISGIEAGRISLSFVPVELGRIIRETLDTLHPLANSLKVKLELKDSGQNQLFVKADHHRLRQVLLNLISNAVKYNHEGGSVMIKTELQPAIAPAISFVRISVIDTGRGINPEYIGKLFLPFERIGAENTGIEGTGLGLMVVKNLMGAMGGRVGVESVPGEGSTFWIELPHIEDYKTGNRQEATGNGQETMQENEKAGTILYIEDNASNTELVEQILLDHRSTIHLVSSTKGAQAVSLAIKYAPDLILLDLDLPDVQGFEVIRLLQAEEKTKEIPVVIISADAMPHQIEKLIKSGSKDYLTKPLDIKAFLQVVDEWVGSANKKTI